MTGNVEFVYGSDKLPEQVRDCPEFLESGVCLNFDNRMDLCTDTDTAEPPPHCPYRIKTNDTKMIPK